MNGVSPEDADSSFVSGLRSGNRTRFLNILDVAGGVDMFSDFEAGELIRERRFRPTLVPLFLLAVIDWSSAVIVE
jgi:hypothetical protein